MFVCTEALSASDKDFAHQFVNDTYGWSLDLFDLERLRVQLVGPQRHLIAQHPSIFAPPFFPQRGGESIAESRDTLLIDHVREDHAVATWLARRLTLAGYRTWCHGSAPLAGEHPDDSVRTLLEARALQYLPLVSTASLSDSIFVERCTIATNKTDFVLPCTVAVASDLHIPSRLTRLVPAVFTDSWNVGLDQVLARLSTLGIKPSLDRERGRQIALRDYLPTRVIVAKPEPVYANVFALQLPESMLLFDLRRSLTEAQVLDLRGRWAFVELGFEVPVPLAISIQHGSADIVQVAKDILGLTKLNYNACQLGEGQPITVKYSDRVGEILLANPGLPPEKWRHNFKYYA